MPHPELEELLNALVPFAQEMLSKHGEFYPFAASMDLDGEISCVAGDTGDEQPGSEDVIELLSEGLRDEARQGKIRATGICLDIWTIPPGKTEKTDAICVRLEHVDGDAVHCCVPYRKGMLGKYKYGDLFAGAGDRVIFTSPK